MTKNKSESVLASLSLVLRIGHKLQLDTKSKSELEEMKARHENSLYARFCRATGISYSQTYLAKDEAIQRSIDWQNMLEYRRELFGRTNCLETSLNNEQLERIDGIKPIPVNS